MSLYYGVDSSSISFPCGADFYIGRIGRGIIANDDFFNYSLAQQTPGSGLQNYAYWGVEGPYKDLNYDGKYTTAITWGYTQAQAFNDAYINHSLLKTLTLFADIEPDFGGWRASGDSLNRAVYQGFMSKLIDLGWIPGVYSSPGSWETIMGSSYSASPAIVEWVANWPTTTCTWCPTSFDGASSFGGLAATIWQYQGATRSQGDECQNDLNVAISFPD